MCIGKYSSVWVYLCKFYLSAFAAHERSMTHSPSNQKLLQCDLVIFGGGIAGLWLLDRLQSSGFHCLLLESTALGNGQSVASQGIIHGGLKFALSGTLTDAANSIADMPRRWSECLKGKGEVDLSRCQLLADQCFMWSDGSARSRLKSFLGSKALRGRVQAIKKSDYPAVFAHSQARGILYGLPDFVIDTQSLLHRLAQRHGERLLKIDMKNIVISLASGGGASRIECHSDGDSIDIAARAVVFCAGEGNQSLLTLAGLAAPQMQLRPLHMVMLKKKGLPSAFVHCIGDSFSLTPKLTLTSHTCRDGAAVWYLGGELAESGVDKSSAAQIDRAKSLLAQTFPWLDFQHAEWASFLINRAEGLSPGQHRPNSVFVRSVGNTVIGWPTKFTLSPALADAVLDELKKQNVHGSGSALWPAVMNNFPRPTVALPPWEHYF
jgi:glycine/D-amino acid oxidase-like deaminating enzyme